MERHLKWMIHDLNWFTGPVVMWMPLWQIPKNWPSSIYHLASRHKPTVPSCNWSCRGYVSPWVSQTRCGGLHSNASRRIFPFLGESFHSGSLPGIKVFGTTVSMCCFGCNNPLFYCVLFGNPVKKRIWLCIVSTRDLACHNLKFCAHAQCFFQQVRTLLIVPLCVLSTWTQLHFIGSSMNEQLWLC